MQVVNTSLVNTFTYRLAPPIQKSISYPHSLFHCFWALSNKNLLSYEQNYKPQILKKKKKVSVLAVIFFPFKSWCRIVDTPILKWYERHLKLSPININKHIIIQDLQTKF